MTEAVFSRHEAEADQRCLHRRGDADEKRLPFEVKAPNRTTIAAMAEADAIIRNRRARFTEAGALFDELEKDG